MLSQIKKDFPLLSRVVNGRQIVYLDNAATTQKPQSVLEAMNEYYSQSNANVSRGVHMLGEESTLLYEQAREYVAGFIGVSSQEVIFTSSTTDSINKIATSAREWLQKDDEILLNVAEHHSNILPWQVVAKQTGAKLVYVGLRDGLFDMDDYKKKLSDKTKFVCVSATSNVLGDDKPIETITTLAHEKNAYVLVDYAQTIAHKTIDASIPDFAAFSAHKIYGPMGLGVLVINNRVKNLLPVVYGGGMIDTVQQDTHSLTTKPWCYEAGTPNVAGAIGLQAAIQYLEHIGLDVIERHESELTTYALEQLQKIQQITILGSQQKHSIISFSVTGIHDNDLAMLLSTKGIFVRSGKHCTDPLHEELTQDSSVRISFGIYNTKEDVDSCVDEIKKITAKQVKE